MATPKRRPCHDMDHDHELLREEIVFANRAELRGPIPEFLAKKPAEQARGTAAGYEVAHDFITAEHERGTSARTVHDRVRRLNTWTRRVRKRGWTEHDRWQDFQMPRADFAEFDLIDPELRKAAFEQLGSGLCSEDPPPALAARPVLRTDRRSACPTTSECANTARPDVLAGVLARATTDSAS